MQGEGLRMTRRDFLRAGGAAPLTAMPLAAWFQDAQADAADGVTPELLFLRRFSYGIRPADWNAIHQLGVAEYLSRQLAQSDALTLTLASALFPLATQSPILFRPTADLPELAWSALNQRRKLTLFMAMFSPAQLKERMVEFWQDHFNTYADSPAQALYGCYKDDSLRRLAFAPFSDLLVAVAKNPAMLVYLDNHVSKKDAINENFARELLELQTLGEGQGYTEEDVREVARCFTGWTADNGQFKYQDDAHDRGSKTVLGQVINAGGMQDGLAVLSLLAAHPNTARHLARKYALAFVSDNPSADLIASLAATFQNSGGRPAAMLRAIVDSSEYQASAGQKFMRPRAFVCSLARCFEAAETESVPDTKLSQLEQMQHLPFGWLAPDGFPLPEGFWLSPATLFQRLTHAIAEGSADQLHANLNKFPRLGNLLQLSNLTGLVSGSDNRVTRLFPPFAFPAAPRTLVRQLAERLLRRSLPAEVEAAIASHIGDGAPDAALPVAAAKQRAPIAAALLLTSPFYMKV